MQIDLVKVAMMFHGTRYKWGGNTPEQGFDCSGLVCEALRSLGHIGKEDYTAKMLYKKFKNEKPIVTIERNDLLFFGSREDNLSHIAIAIDDFYMVESGGEGREDTSEGYVRIRPIKSRGDFYDVIRL